MLSQHGLIFGWHNPVLKRLSSNDDGTDHDDLNREEYKRAMMMYMTQISNSRYFTIESAGRNLQANITKAAIEEEAVKNLI